MEEEEEEEETRCPFSVKRPFFPFFFQLKKRYSDAWTIVGYNLRKVQRILHFIISSRLSIPFIPFNYSDLRVLVVGENDLAKRIPRLYNTGSLGAGYVCSCSSTRTREGGWGEKMAGGGWKYACKKKLRESSLLEKLGQKIRPRLEGSRRLFVAFPSVSPTILHPPLTLAPLTRLFLAPIHRRLFTPWLLSFFQSRRCNDSNLEVRTRHTRRQPTPYLPSTSSHLLSLSLPFSLPLSLPLSLSFYHDERQRSKFFVLHKQRAFTTRIHLPRG